MTALELEVRPDLRPRVHRLVVLNHVLEFAIVVLAVVAAGLLAYLLIRPGPSVAYPATGVLGVRSFVTEPAAPVVRDTPSWDWQALVTEGRTPPMGAYTWSFDYETLVTEGRTPPMGDYVAPQGPRAFPISRVTPATPAWDWQALVTEGRTPPMGDYR